jgi:biopolymer transport protein ExbD
MGGVNVSTSSGGARRSLDSEINMIPMIDLLMVTISFLLITAVWSHMARISTNAQVPGRVSDIPDSDEPAAKRLHIQMRADGSFGLAWKKGAVVVETSEVPKNDVVTMQGAVRVVRFPELAAKVEDEWMTHGSHRAPTDPKLDQVVLHTDNETPYASIVGAMDAVSHVERSRDFGKKAEKIPAFNLTFAPN